MPAASLVKAAYLSWFCHPQSDRRLFRAVRRIRPSRIVELGFGDGLRAKRLISLAKRYRPDEVIHYAAVDLFEAAVRSHGSGSPERSASAVVRSGAKVRLIPGEPTMALARCANALKDTDLLVIDAIWNPHDFAGAWFYVPRMLHDRSTVAQYLREQDRSTPKLTFLSCGDVNLHAQAADKGRRAA